VDGVHTAGLGAGALDLADGVIGALIHAAAALDALVVVNDAVAIGVGADGVLGTYRLAGMAQAALAIGTDAHLLLGAGIACEGNDVNERGLVILFGDVGLFDTLAGQTIFRRGAQRQPAGQAQAFGDDGTLAENAVAVVGDLAGDDLIGELVDTLDIVLISHAGDFLKHGSSQLVNDTVDTSHIASFCVI